MFVITEFLCRLAFAAWIFLNGFRRLDERRRLLGNLLRDLGLQAPTIARRANHVGKQRKHGRDKGEEKVHCD